VALRAAATGGGRVHAGNRRKNGGLESHEVRGGRKKAKAKSFRDRGYYIFTSIKKKKTKKEED